MRKVSMLIAVMVTITGMLFASGEGEQGKQGRHTLKVLHYLDLDDDVSAGNFDALVAQFERLHPGITLDFDFLTGGQYHNELQARAAADELPDVMFLWPGKITEQVTKNGKVHDLRPWLEGHEDEFGAGALNGQGANGEIWELPEQVIATHVMFTNDRLLRELGLSFPETLDELIAQGDVIRAAGYIPIAMDNKEGWQMQSSMLSALVDRTGGQAWFDKAITGEAHFTDDEFVDALQVIDRLAKNNMFSPGVNQAEYGRALNDFVTGEAVYFIDGEWRAANLTEKLDPASYDNISLRVIPSVENERGQSGSTAIVTGAGFGINAKLTDEKADAAWAWVWFFSGPDGSLAKQEQGWRSAYTLPPTESTPKLEKDLVTFVANTPGGYSIDAVMDLEGMEILQVGIQEMISGNITPSQVAHQYEDWVAANDSRRQ